LVAKPGVRYLCNRVLLNRGRQCFFSQVENLDGNTALNRGQSTTPDEGGHICAEMVAFHHVIAFFLKENV
jgi:hypothetical protein